MLFMMAFWLRPGMDRFPTVKQVTKIDNGTSYVVNVTVRDPCHLLLMRTDEDKVGPIGPRELLRGTLSCLCSRSQATILFEINVSAITVEFGLVNDRQTSNSNESKRNLDSSTNVPLSTVNSSGHI